MRQALTKQIEAGHARQVPSTPFPVPACSRACARLGRGLATSRNCRPGVSPGTTAQAPAQASRPPGGSRVPYRTPGHDVVAIIDAPPTPLALLAPGGRFAALVHSESHPPIALPAPPY